MANETLCIDRCGLCIHAIYSVNHETRLILALYEMFCLQVLVVGDSITRLLPTTAPGIDVKTFPGIDSERLLKEVG